MKRSRGGIILPTTSIRFAAVGARLIGGVITVARSLPFSSSCKPSIVVPPGLVT